jgi:hypothetical protein
MSSPFIVYVVNLAALLIDHIELILRVVLLYFPRDLYTPPLVDRDLQTIE